MVVCVLVVLVISAFGVAVNSVVAVDSLVLVVVAGFAIALVLISCLPCCFLFWWLYGFWFGRCGCVVFDCLWFLRLWCCGSALWCVSVVVYVLALRIWWCWGLCCRVSVVWVFAVCVLVVVGACGFEMVWFWGACGGWVSYVCWWLWCCFWILCFVGVSVLWF